jgi:hypothetical protein
VDPKYLRKKIVVSIGSIVMLVGFDTNFLSDLQFQDLLREQIEL